MKNKPKENLCRSCMCENKEMVSVFQFHESSKNEYNHAYMLMAFTSVQISVGDGLPELICLECADQISQCYLFKLKCEHSDMVLRKQETDSEFCTTNYDNLMIKIEDNQIKEEYQNDFYDDINFNDDSTSEQDDEATDKSHASGILTVKKKCTKKSLDKNENRTSKIKTKDRFKCKTCRKSFLYERCLIKHMKNQHDVSLESHRSKTPRCKAKADKVTEDRKAEKKYCCDKCPISFSEEELLTKHINERHFCAICVKKVKYLNIHLRSHTGEKAYLCALCGKGFSQQAGYNEHMLRHSGIRSFTCDTCEMSFITKGELVSHSLKHSENKQFQCDICSSTFSRSDTLYAHREIVHFGRKKWECDICRKTFTQSHSLVKHKLIHSGEKPHSCNFCEKKFTQKATLIAHLRTHTGDKPYVCSTCGQVFGQRSTLRSHKNKENH